MTIKPRSPRSLALLCQYCFQSARPFRAMTRTPSPREERADRPRRSWPLATNPLVAFRFVFRAGSQSDPAGKEGLAALTAAMVAEGGTRSRTYEQVLAAFYPMAATLDAACHKEATVFSGLVHRDSVDAYLNLADRDAHPAAVRTRRFRAAPQRGARLRHEIPARKQRRRARQVDADDLAVQGSSLRTSRPRHGRWASRRSRSTTSNRFIASITRSSRWTAASPAVSSL